MEKRPIKYLILVFVMFLLIPTESLTAESDSYYSVQAGAYALSAIKFAARQFDRLSNQLSEADRYLLRIEKGTTYYIIRIGQFRDKESALELMNRVRELVPDAYVTKRENFDESMIVRLYKKPDASAPDLAEYYTLQTGNFLKMEDAGEEFNRIMNSIPERDLGSLRIERTGVYYSVRLGKFENYGLGRDFQIQAGEALRDAIILKAYLKDEQVLRTFNKDEVSEIVVVDGSSISVERVAKPSPTVQKEDVSTNSAPVDDLIGEVSRYYDGDDYGKAAELLRQGLAKWPDNPDLRAWYGATLLNMRFPEKAYEQYSKAIEISPDVPDYHAGMGFSLLDIYMDKAKNSIEAFKRALEIDPNNVSALEGLGIVYVSIDKKDLATDLYYRLREIDIEAADRLRQIINNGLAWEEE